MERPVPPTGFAAVRVAAKATAAGAPRGRRRLGLLLLTGIPVVIVALALLAQDSGRGRGFTTFSNLVTVMYLPVIVPLIMIFLGTGSFGDEWAGGTPHYVMGLPVPRLALVLGRWVMCVRRALVLVLPALGAVYVLCLLPYDGAWSHYLMDLVWVLVMVSLLAFTYGAIFMFVGLALKRAVITALVYTFVFEGIIAQLPQTFAVLSLGFHVRNVLWQVTEQDPFQLETTNLVDVEPIAPALSITVILAVTLLALLGSTLVLHLKECGGEGQAGEAANT